MDKATLKDIEDIRAQLVSLCNRDTISIQLEAQGKLLRPCVAHACAKAIAPELLNDDPLWFAILAVQSVHEASLLHDDIIDEAETRRGKPTLVAKAGIPTALVMGDHLLTASYHLLSQCDNIALFSCFSRAVEQTVVGEIKQARSADKEITIQQYMDMITDKTGALFGFAMGIPALLQRREDADEWIALGEWLGRLYQMLDDILDYCPQAGTGKPPFQDYIQHKPTWPWLLQETPNWQASTKELHTQWFGQQAHAQRCLDFFEEECDAFQRQCKEKLGDTHTHFVALVEQWRQKVKTAIHRECAELREQQTSTRPLGHSISSERKFLQALLVQQRLDRPTEWQEYFAKNSRSFSFASRFFPSKPREQVSSVYAYARFTDDLADDLEHLSLEERTNLILEWREISRQAHTGRTTGFYLADRVMGEMGDAQVPFQYAHDLIEGMLMDLEGHTYNTIEELEHYCYCVASTIGLWLTELFGQHHPWVLERAQALGKAMQLTNILRDVGEDLRRDRIYLPSEVLEEFGLSASSLQHLAHQQGPVPESYRELMESLMDRADRYYRLAWVAIPALPGFFQRPVAVAGRVYQGIHRELRNNAYDNFNKRAHTSTLRKVFLMFFALRDLRQAKSHHQLEFKQPTQLDAPSSGRVLLRGRKAID